MSIKEKAICGIVDTAVRVLAETFSEKHIRQISNPEGVINSKKNNCFISALGNDFIVYSALSRSFDIKFAVNSDIKIPKLKICVSVLGNALNVKPRTR